MDLSKLLHGFMDFSWFLHGFVKIDIGISLRFYMYLSIFLHGFVKVVTWIWFLCISRPLPNKTKLKFDQDFKACWSSCLELGRWMSQSAQCLRSIVPLAMFLSFLALWNIYQCKFNAINFPEDVRRKNFDLFFQTLLWIFWIIY